MNQSLTLLQRVVIQRVRNAGFSELALLADDRWSRGEEVPAGDSVALDGGDGQLRREFAQANGRAHRPSELA